MTKLEEQMLKAIEKARYDYGNASGGNEDSFIAEGVAEIARDLARRAWNEATSKGYHGERYYNSFESFIERYD